jgi:hypothetical protein
LQCGDPASRNYRPVVPAACATDCPFQVTCNRVASPGACSVYHSASSGIAAAAKAQQQQCSPTRHEEQNQPALQPSAGPTSPSRGSVDARHQTTDRFSEPSGRASARKCYCSASEKPQKEGVRVDGSPKRKSSSRRRLRFSEEPPLMFGDAIDDRLESRNEERRQVSTR